MRIDLNNFKENEFTCQNCSWSGKGSELGLGEVFMDSAIVEYDCPKCFEKIAYGQGNIVDEEALIQFEKSKIEDRLKVFEVGGEGGSISIFSENKESRTPFYYFEVNDMGFEEEDIPPTCRKSEISYTFWESLMKLRLDKPYLYKLYPHFVAKDYRNDIISLFRLLKEDERIELNYISWSVVLGISKEELIKLVAIKSI